MDNISTSSDSSTDSVDFDSIIGKFFFIQKTYLVYLFI